MFVKLEVEERAINSIWIRFVVLQDQWHEYVCPNGFTMCTCTEPEQAMQMMGEFLVFLKTSW